MEPKTASDAKEETMNYILLFIAYFALTSILYWWANRPEYENPLLKFAELKSEPRPFTEYDKLYGQGSELACRLNSIHDSAENQPVHVYPISIAKWAEQRRLNEFETTGKIKPGPISVKEYHKSAIDQTQDDKVEKVVLLQGKDRAVFMNAVQCGNPFPWFLIHPDGTQEEIDENRISSPDEFKQQYLANPWPPESEAPEAVKNMDFTKEYSLSRDLKETSPWQPGAWQYIDSKRSINGLIRDVKAGDSFKFFVSSSSFYAWGSAEGRNIVSLSLKGSRESIKDFHQNNPDLFKLEDYLKSKPFKPAKGKL